MGWRQFFGITVPTFRPTLYAKPRRVNDVNCNLLNKRTSISRIYFDEEYIEVNKNVKPVFMAVNSSKYCTYNETNYTDKDGYSDCYVYV